MKAKYDTRSWEKCKVLNLENGWTAYEQYNTSHGPYISALHSPDGKVWQASNGSPDNPYSIGGAAKANGIFGGDKYIDIPDFAQSWQDKPTANNPWPLIRPHYEII